MLADVASAVDYDEAGNSVFEEGSVVAYEKKRTWKIHYSFFE